MKKFFCVLSVVVLAVCLIFTGCKKENELAIRVGGSTSVNPLMEMFQEAYANVNENISITVSATGSGDGIRNAASGTYDLGMSSRELTAAEMGTDIVPVIVAMDGIAVIVNNSNPVSNLTAEQINQIYTGEITLWEDLGDAAQGKTGAIAVISRESGSGTRGAFEEILGFQDQLVSGASIINSTGAIKAAVTGNVDAIGYISLGSVDNSSKALNVGGVAATAANVKTGTYVIARPFILMHQRSVAPNSQTSAFLNWILGPEGQAIVQRSWISVH